MLRHTNLLSYTTPILFASKLTYLHQQSPNSSILFNKISPLTPSHASSPPTAIIPIRYFASQSKNRNNPTAGKVKSNAPTIKAVGVKRYIDTRSKSKIIATDTYNIVATLTANNTFLVLTSPINEIIIATSCGCHGFSGSSKSTYMANITSSNRLAQRAKNLGVQYLNIYFKGFNKNKRAVLKGIQEVPNLIIKRLEDRTPVPFNGCRPKKSRRL